jgi:hypothetical protein
MLSLATQQLHSQEDWPFYSPDHPLTDAVRDGIVRVRMEDAVKAWNQFVSPEAAADAPRLLPAGHWIENLKSVGPDWKSYWKRYWDNPESYLTIPGGADDVAAFLKSSIHWEPTAEVIFFRSSRYALITTWQVFLSCWCNFVYDNEGPFLLSPSQPEVVYFADRGFFAMGTRPGPYIRE